MKDTKTQVLVHFSLAPSHGTRLGQMQLTEKKLAWIWETQVLDPEHTL